MVYAPAWQQLAICGLMIAAGVAILVFTGHPGGVIPIVFGAVFGARMIKPMIRGGRERGGRQG